MKWKYKWNELFFFNDTLSAKIKNWTQSRGMLLVTNLTNMGKQKVSKQNGEQTSHYKGFNPEYSLEGLIWKLRLQTFGHLMQRTDSLERPWSWGRLKTGKEGDDRGWDGWMASQTRCTWVWANSGSWWWTGRPGVLLSMGSQRVGHDWATKLNWTELACVTFLLDDAGLGFS